MNYMHKYGQHACSRWHSLFEKRKKDYKINYPKFEPNDAENPSFHFISLCFNGTSILVSKRCDWCFWPLEITTSEKPNGQQQEINCWCLFPKTCKPRTWAFGWLRTCYLCSTFGTLDPHEMYYHMKSKHFNHFYIENIPFIHVGAETKEFCDVLNC